MCNFPTFVAFIYFKLTLPREKCNKISPSPYPRAVAGGGGVGFTWKVLWVVLGCVG